MDYKEVLLKKPKYKVIDLFAGAGGLSNGFEQTGRFEVIGAVEINPAAAKTYIYNHENKEDIFIRSEGESISNIINIDFGKFLSKNHVSGSEIVVIGGPPCQGFSNANRQKNYLISGNNQLVKEFVRAIKEIRPVAFLMENVRTMDSEIHKFFVTEHHENSKFAYSSEEHLMEINQQHNEYFWKDDSITLIETTCRELEAIFGQALNKNLNEPLIHEDYIISRLRGLERKSLKNKHVYLQSEKEKQGILHTVNYLKENIICNEPDMVLLVTRAIGVLQKLVNQEVLSEEVKTHIIPLLDLNRFLIHYREIISEKIVLRKPIVVKKEGDKIVVKALVRSYNVVEYLKRFFMYLGYKIDNDVLTATNYGVPQRRKRFMIVGIREDKLIGETVSLPKNIKHYNRIHTTHDAIGDLEKIRPQHEVESYKPMNYTDNSNLSVLQRYYRKGNHHGQIYNHINTKSTNLSIKRFKAIKEIGGKNFHSLSEELKDTYTDTSRTQNTIYLRLKYNEPSPTVINVRKSMWNHPVNAVALSIREAARLQSFRDNFIFYGSKDQQYQQVGNAVPPLMARAVAERILDLLGDHADIRLENEFNSNQTE
ncbi:DNA cytosine methyltransferase [Brevibacillus laterosporus]|uniref:DNA cytosine methyltransferase n=1 Tax=Brevibacillus laterosporus TaxID=1465 RepID=UPI0020D0552F|nr:DNA cytosine methyltransferase [Brevibacillus laterosporus]